MPTSMDNATSNTKRRTQTRASGSPQQRGTHNTQYTREPDTTDWDTKTRTPHHEDATNTKTKKLNTLHPPYPLRLLAFGRRGPDGPPDRGGVNSP